MCSINKNTLTLHLLTNNIIWGKYLYTHTHTDVEAEERQDVASFCVISVKKKKKRKIKQHENECKNIIKKRRGNKSQQEHIPRRIYASHLIVEGSSLHVSV